MLRHFNFKIYLFEKNHKDFFKTSEQLDEDTLVSWSQA